MPTTSNGATQGSYNYSSKPNPGSLESSSQQGSQNHWNLGSEKNSRIHDEKNSQNVPQNGATTGVNSHHGNPQQYLQNIGAWAVGQQPEAPPDYPTDIEIGSDNDPENYAKEREKHRAKSTRRSVE